MSLYDGLEMEVNEGRKDTKPDVSGWGSRSKLLETQKHIQAKKASLINIKKKQNTTVAPVFDLKKRNEESPLTFNMQTGKIERLQGAPRPPSPTTPTPAAPVSSPAPVVNPFLAVEAPGSFLGVTDEYDPLRPNDYETFTKRRKEQKLKEREEERRKEAEDRERRRKERHHDNKYSDEEDEEEEERRRRRRRRRDEERDRDREDRDREDRDREDRERDREDRDRDKEKSNKGAAIAPPKSLLEDTVKAEPEPSASSDGKPSGSGGDYGGGFNVGKGSVVSRMMAKMGYREGSGLGKSEQGMSTALLVEKTSKRGGKIIHEKDIPKDPPKATEMSNANLLKNPSKVLLLRNMVGPGEVDEELEGETAEECSKYGKVIKCIIFEIPGAIEEDAVRIFVEFERVESAIKAVVDLNGRFFGGRTVKGCFYNLDRFRRLDLADPLVD